MKSGFEIMLIVKARQLKVSLDEIRIGFAMRNLFWEKVVLKMI